MKKLFSNLNIFYESTVNWDTQKRINKFIRKNDFVLDAGSRNCAYSRNLANKIIAIDIDFLKEDLMLLSGYKNIKLIKSSVDSMPFRDSYFDKVIFTEVLEHLKNGENAISEISRVLKKGGTLLLTTPNKEVVPLPPLLNWHVRHYSDKELYNLLKKYFNEVRISKRFFFRPFLELQYKFMKQYRKNNRKKFLLLSMMFSGLYNLSYKFFKYFLTENYNLIAICSKPMKNEK
jgi:ubiquinone/menaquinone biosynthesis C-methylase UbiE